MKCLNVKNIHPTTLYIYGEQYLRDLCNYINTVVGLK